MALKIILCAFSHRLTAGVWRMGRLESCVAFQKDETGFDDFRAFLHQYQRVPIRLIVDMVEEDYRIETTPHTTGRVRQALLERKLGQLYRTAMYRAAHFIGRERGQRRDDIFLLVALSNNEIILPWIRVLEEMHAPLAGIHLLPMVSQILLHRLSLNAPHLLLLDGQVDGLRQSYFCGGQLYFSRLVPDIAWSNDRHAQLYLGETEKTRRYLLSQHLIVPDTKFSLLIRVSDPADEKVCRVVGNKLGMECLALAPSNLASQLGLDESVLPQFPELLYMQVLATGTAPVNLAPSVQIREYLLHRWCSWIEYSAAGLLFGGLLLSALNFMDAQHYRSQLYQAKSQTLAFERRYNEVARNFPATPWPGRDLKMVVELSQNVAANQHTPQRLMQIMAAALDRVPEVRLLRLHWKLTNHPDAEDESNAARPPAGTPVQAEAGPVAPGVLRELGFIDGEIGNFSSDYRAAQDSLNHLTERLRQDPRLESVAVTMNPGNVSTYSRLPGSTESIHEQQKSAAQFKLRLVLKQVVAP